MDDRPLAPDADAPAPTAPRDGARRWALALVVVAVAAVGWVALPRGTAPVPAPAPDPADSAPAASPVDLTGHAAPETTYTAFDGTSARLADLRGTPIVVNFWASWCPPCVGEMPAFERVHQAYGDRVRFVGLAVNDAEASARTRARLSGVTYPLGFDPEGRIGAAFGLVNLPATVLIDRDGTVVHISQAHALSAEELTALVDAELLAGAGAAGRGAG
jgi:thiol-disulfide isomerase/thioredoxin